MCYPLALMKSLDQIGREKDIAVEQPCYPTGINFFDEKLGRLTHGINLFAARPRLGFRHSMRIDNLLIGVMMLQN